MPLALLLVSLLASKRIQVCWIIQVRNDDHDIADFILTCWCSTPYCTRKFLHKSQHHEVTTPKLFVSSIYYTFESIKPISISPVTTTNHKRESNPLAKVSFLGPRVPVVNEPFTAIKTGRSITCVQRNARSGFVTSICSTVFTSTRKEPLWSTQLRSSDRFGSVANLEIAKCLCFTIVAHFTSIKGCPSLPCEVKTSAKLYYSSLMKYYSLVPCMRYVHIT